jgi:hypothetical protein
MYKTRLMLLLSLFGLWTLSLSLSLSLSIYLSHAHSYRFGFKIHLNLHSAPSLNPVHTHTLLGSLFLVFSLYSATPVFDSQVHPCLTNPCHTVNPQLDSTWYILPYSHRRRQSGCVFGEVLPQPAVLGRDGGGVGQGFPRGSYATSAASIRVVSPRQKVCVCMCMCA